MDYTPQPVLRTFLFPKQMADSFPHYGGVGISVHARPIDGDAPRCRGDIQFFLVPKNNALGEMPIGVVHHSSDDPEQLIADAIHMATGQMTVPGFLAGYKANHPHTLGVDFSTDSSTTGLYRAVTEPPSKKEAPYETSGGIQDVLVDVLQHFQQENDVQLAPFFDDSVHPSGQDLIMHVLMQYNRDRARRQ